MREILSHPNYAGNAGIFGLFPPGRGCLNCRTRANFDVQVEISHTLADIMKFKVKEAEK